ncbi:hypothetical protein SDC9_205027 [bioreactor metagenome]|uniref:Peptidase S8/S53 domain-containing protein n=1 Tax=bioreactor metagenome TaxID=1076179 RepID=A0A645JCQ9_9ZZZZ
MSSPVVAGAVALMLSADPKLTPEKIIDLLKSNATVDNYTKEVPNPVWGWGKLNLRKAFNYVGIDELNYCKNSTNVYPNPTTLGSATIALELENTCNLRIVLSDVIGREILPIYDGTAEAGTFTKSFTTQNLHKGIYFIKTLIDGKYKLEKIVVND